MHLHTRSRYRLERKPSYTYAQTIDLESGNGYGIFEAYNRTWMGDLRRYRWGRTFRWLQRSQRVHYLHFYQIVRGGRAFRLFYDQWSPYVYFLSSNTARIPHLIPLSSNVTKPRSPSTTRNATISSPQSPNAFSVNMTLRSLSHYWSSSITARHSNLRTYRQRTTLPSISLRQCVSTKCTHPQV